jgi:osmoprotectant transport system permease protein
MRRVILIMHGIAICLLFVMLFKTEWLSPIFVRWTNAGSPAIYNRTSLLELALSHLAIVWVASFTGTMVALATGIFVTRPSGAEFLPVARSVVNIGQTFPPVAVLALAVPAVGFGVKPVLLALFLYGLLPIFESTIAGLRAIPSTTLESACGMGMSAWQQLLYVELPLALPVILNGIRLSVVINLATATIGSTIAAKSLGDVIIAGLQTSNTAFVLQGAIGVALLAIVIDYLLGLAVRERAVLTNYLVY